MGKRSKAYAKKRKRLAAEAQSRIKQDPNIHPIRSNPRGYWYRFHTKHHYPTCKRGEGCWLRSIDRQTEFQIFELAERYDLSDEAGHLYNVYKDDDGEFIEIGDRHEQLAKFWKPPSNIEWHGFPYWSIHTRDSTSNKKEINRPPLSVLEKMVRQNILPESKALRLRNGNII